jgi:putative RNA 2'-phosphotransferase
MTSELPNPQRCTKISKYLSKHLRHQPERIGLELLPGGWVQVEQLLAAAAQHGFELSLLELQHIVSNNDKQRFAFDDSGDLIRAHQGHSTEVDLQLPVRTPPATLYHGTHTQVVTAILRTGLQKMSRHHVHLTTNLTTAHEAGGRRGKSIIIAVNAILMESNGHDFYCTDNDVWLVESVPPQYLKLLTA